MNNYHRQTTIIKITATATRQTKQSAKRTNATGTPWGFRRNHCESHSDFYSPNICKSTPFSFSSCCCCCCCCFLVAVAKQLQMCLLSNGSSLERRRYLVSSSAIALQALLTVIYNKHRNKQIFTRATVCVYCVCVRLYVDCMRIRINQSCCGPNWKTWRKSAHMTASPVQVVAATWVPSFPSPPVPLYALPHPT